MAVDTHILGVLGSWSPTTAQAVTPEYERYGLAVLAPEADAICDQPAVLSDRAFVEGYEALSGGVPPGTLAAWAYSAAVGLLDAIDVAVVAEGQPSRTEVLTVLDANQGH
jgi:ABC-type branched-subunit amino acid transport system substrate-binding protein